MNGGVPKEQFASILGRQPKKVIDLTSDKEEEEEEEEEKIPPKKIRKFDEDLVHDPFEENLNNALMVSAVLEEEGISANLSDMMRYGVVSETSLPRSGKGKTVFVFDGESKKVYKVDLSKENEIPAYSDAFYKKSKENN